MWVSWLGLWLPVALCLVVLRLGLWVCCFVVCGGNLLCSLCWCVHLYLLFVVLFGLFGVLCFMRLFSVVLFDVVVAALDFAMVCV